MLGGGGGESFSVQIKVSSRYRYKDGDSDPVVEEFEGRLSQEEVQRMTLGCQRAEVGKT